MMNYYSYNLACLITSILMLFILLFKFKQINLCLILLLSAIFSIIWRSIKIIKGKENIEKNNNHNYSLTNTYFILDFSFAILALICVLVCKQINIKFILLIIFVFSLSWILNFVSDSNIIKKNNLKNKIINLSHTVHFSGHCYLLLIVFITFYLYII